MASNINEMHLRNCKTIFHKIKNKLKVNEFCDLNKKKRIKFKKKKTDSNKKNEFVQFYLKIDFYQNSVFQILYL